ncbi:hypothetical protein JCM9279_004739 [Rhodotorula babjevae]
MSLPQDLNMDELPSQPYASPRLLKWFYCTNRVSSSLFLLPVWAVKYAVKKRPRPSWSLAETLLVDFTRRVSAITDQAGVQHATRDPTAEPRTDDLKETRFEWVPGVAGEFLSGVLVDEQVKPLERVGTFVWERAEDVREDYAMLNAKDAELAAEDDDAEREEGGSAFGSRFSLAAQGDKGDLVGIYFHGGGYTHFSAHESAQTSTIPRRLMQYDYFSAIHSVEYRLLPDSPFPAALQDGISVYAHLVKAGVPAHKIVLIGDSAGGNIVLALARFIRDCGVARLAAPGGLLLLSPWCDPSRCFKDSLSSYAPRPNPEDYLSDEPTARRLLVSSLLGTKPHSELSSPYISPASQLGPQGSFDRFPPTFVHYGDAERLEDEIDSLVEGLKRDQVPLLDVEKTPDAVHDVLMVRFWNEDVRATIYSRVCGWLDRVVARGKLIDRGVAHDEASRQVASARRCSRGGDIYHDDEPGADEGPIAGPSGEAASSSRGAQKADDGEGRTIPKAVVKEAVMDQIHEIRDLKKKGH